MRRTRIKPRRFCSNLVATLALGLPITASAFAQDPVVNSADPAETEQGTVALDVTVRGDNFGADSEVDFLVSCDPQQDPGCDQTPSGVVAYGVKRQGPKTLKFKIDVVEGAQTKYKLDIQVQSRGRTGKGIELFRVIEKTHPTQDTTPPGAVTVEYIGTEYNEVFLEWIAPADDGYDPASGPAGGYQAKCAPGVVTFDLANWDAAKGCTGVGDDGPFAGLPGSVERFRFTGGEPGFEPSRTYSIAVRVIDNDGVLYPKSAVSNTVTFNTDAYSPAPGWTVERLPIPVGHSLGHVFDLSGSPLIMGLFEDRIRIIKGTWNSIGGSWEWSFEDVLAAADSFALDPAGAPAFGWMKMLNTNRAEVFYTFFDGAHWVTEFVATADGEQRGLVNVAFDLDGEPVLAYYHWDGGAGGVTLARRSEVGEWSIEAVDASPGGGATGWFLRKGKVAVAFGPLGQPALAYSVDVDGDDYNEIVKFASFDGAAWRFEQIDFDNRDGWDWEIGHAGELAYDAARGDFTYLYRPPWRNLRYCEREAETWQCWDPFYGAAQNLWPYTVDDAWVSNPDSRGLVIDGSGEIFIPYEVGRDARLAHSIGGVTWQYEVVDVAWLHPDFQYAPFGVNPFAARVALDSTGQPSLSWVWARDDSQLGDLTLYFAWKDATPIVCGDGYCNGAEDSCSCPGDCGGPASSEVGLCADLSDNDCDTFVDCDDNDCNLDPVCPSCGDTYCDAAESSCTCPADCGVPLSSEAGLCSDSVDNDCDGDLNCDDIDCAGDESCVAGGGSPGDPCTTGADCLSGLCHPVKLTCK